MIVHDDSARRRARPSDVDAAERPVPLDLADLSGRSVLLVDDDADALEMAKDALSIAGATVVTAASAEEALAALDRSTFDAAVLDIGLPELDGYELMRRIRARGRRTAGRSARRGAHGLCADGRSDAVAACGISAAPLEAGAAQRAGGRRALDDERRTGAD